MFDVETDPARLVREVAEGGTSFSGPFVLRSGRYLFPQHGWLDDVPVRLAEFALALKAIESHSICERVMFADSHYAIELHSLEEATEPDTIRVTYHDAYHGGLVYQEHLRVADIRRSVAMRIEQTINVCVRRRWLGPVPGLSTALEGLAR